MIYTFIEQTYSGSATMGVHVTGVEAGSFSEAVDKALNAVEPENSSD